MPPPPSSSRRREKPSFPERIVVWAMIAGFWIPFLIHLLT